MDEPDYPITRGMTFSATDQDDGGARFLYSGVWPDGTRPDLRLLITDDAHDLERLLAKDGPVAALAGDGVPVTVVTFAARPIVFPLDPPAGSGSTTGLPDPLHDRTSAPTPPTRSPGC